MVLKIQASLNNSNILSYFVLLKNKKPSDSSLNNANLAPPNTNNILFKLKRNSCYRRNFCKEHFTFNSK